MIGIRKRTNSQGEEETMNRCSTTGQVSLKFIFYMLILVVVGYVGIRLGAPYYANMALKRTMHQWASWVVLSDSRSHKKIREEVQRTIDHYDIPLQQDDIVIYYDRDEELFVVDAVYDVYVELPYYTHHQRFNPRIEVESRSYGG